MTEFVPVQVLMPDDLFKPREARLSRNPTERDQIPLTGAGGRVPAAGVDVGSPPTITIHGATLVLAISSSSDGVAPVAGLAVQQHSDTPGLAGYALFAQSGGTGAAPTVSISGDTLGYLSFCGHDGTDHEEAAQITAEVDGTPGDNDMPGRLVFRVTPDGSTTAVEAMRISNTKAITCAGAVAITGALTMTGAIIPAATQRMVSCLTEVVTAASLVDGGAGLGTKVLTMSIPVGARIVGIDVTVEAGFAGDTTATFKLGDGSDDDRYMTGAPSVFATAAAGIAAGIPSGAVNVLVANTPTVTINSTGTIGNVIAGGGSLTVRVYFIPRS